MVIYWLGRVTVYRMRAVYDILDVFRLFEFLFLHREFQQVNK